MTYALHEPWPGVKLWVDADAGDMERLKAEGRYEWRKVDYIREHLQPGMTFVDVGAHIGYFTMLAASIVGEGGRVIAWEPLRENYRLLLDSRECNGYRKIANIFQIALGNQNGYCNFYAGHTNGQWSLKAISDQHGTAYQATLNGLLVGNIDMLKIDVEGAELEVLQGATETLKNTHHILMDLHPEYHVDMQAIQDLLHGAGFQLYDMRRDNAPIETIPPNCHELLAVRA